MRRYKPRFTVDQNGSVTDHIDELAREQDLMSCPLYVQALDQSRKNNDYQAGKFALRLSGLVGVFGYLLVAESDLVILSILGILLILFAVVTFIAGARMFARDEP